MTLIDPPLVLTERQLYHRDLWSTLLGTIIGAGFTTVLCRYPQVMEAVAWAAANVPIWNTPIMPPAIVIHFP